MDADDLDRRLEQLAAAAMPPAAGARLAALLACDSVRGLVAIACWQLDADHQHWQLLDLESGARIDDDVLMREALVLVAMAETLIDHADQEMLEGAATTLESWSPRMEGPGSEQLAAALVEAARAMRSLADAARTPAGALHAAPGELDRIGGMFRELERSWSIVDVHARQWARTAAVEQDAGSLHELWEALARVKGGPLSLPVSVLLERGREAGRALAADVLAARVDQ